MSALLVPLFYEHTQQKRGFGPKWCAVITLSAVLEGRIFYITPYIFLHSTFYQHIKGQERLYRKNVKYAKKVTSQKMTPSAPKGRNEGSGDGRHHSDEADTRILS